MWPGGLEACRSPSRLWGKGVPHVSEGDEQEKTHPDASGSAATIATQMQNAFALNIGKVVGSHATVARHLDALAAINGLTGVMCIFDDFVPAIEDFGRNVMPLLHCR